ncbi:MAG: hypothetical protein DRP93_08505, partial [Candidatus Neomarinimicrobiota bacterium]
MSHMSMRKRYCAGGIAFNKRSIERRCLSGGSVSAWLSLNGDLITDTDTESPTFGKRFLVNSKGDDVLSTTGQMLTFNEDGSVHVGYLTEITCNTFIINLDGGTTGYFMRWQNIFYSSGGKITLYYDGANHSTTISTPLKGQV